jgi:malonyl-CoA/methylmalonyl-CoA synthetase
MGLSNPYRGGERRAGHVGQPLPGVTVQLYDTEQQRAVLPGEVDVPGEIRVKGDNVFLEYWNNPQVIIIKNKENVRLFCNYFAIAL